MTTTPKRLQAIDLVRAITMLLMIFVNDVAGVADIPGWIGHAAATEDRLGFSDTIFPAFLFIVGLSLPFAISNRLNKGDSFLSIAGHILWRSAALIIMGFFHVNLENYNEASAVLSRDIWAIAITIAFFLIWLDYPAGFSKTKKYLLMGTGAAILIIMAILYKGGDAANPSGMKPHWWGILGIIGWAYLICALAYLIIKGNLTGLLAVTILFIVINILSHTDSVPFEIPVLGDASSASLIMIGALTGILYTRLTSKNNYLELWLLFTAMAIFLLASGFLIRPYAGGISKIMATPAWIFICAAITILVLEICIWISDIKGKQNWFRIIRPAGSYTLTAYLLPYLLYAIYSLTGFRYPAFLNEGIGGIIRSFIVAFGIIIITGLLTKKQIRLKV